MYFPYFGKFCKSTTSLNGSRKFIPENDRLREVLLRVSIYIYIYIYIIGNGKLDFTEFSLLMSDFMLTEQEEAALEMTGSQHAKENAAKQKRQQSKFVYMEVY